LSENRTLDSGSQTIAVSSSELVSGIYTLTIGSKGQYVRYKVSVQH
ncbi:MAG: hypothetical protein RLZZ318_922, partial [Bacteroidota bacterium]